MIFIRAFQFQGQPAFILKAYNPERYLEPVRKEGKEERRRQADLEKTDFRLLPLNPSELMYAEASHMELGTGSECIDFVKSYLQASMGIVNPTQNHF